MVLVSTVLMCVCVCVRADQGRLLDYVVSWGNLTEGKVAHYLRDVLEALHYLHSRRIVHLDVKVSPPSLDRDWSLVYRGGYVLKPPPPHNK